MKIKVTEADGIVLDYFVGIANGRTVKHDPMKFRDGSYWIWEEVPSGRGGVLIDKCVYKRIGKEYSPSNDWSEGGKIIAMADICWFRNINNDITAHCWHVGERYEGFDKDIYPNKPAKQLVAAMRCYVISRLGAEVDVPALLLKAQNKS